MNTIYFKYYKSPFGELKIGSFQNEVCLCDWRYRKNRELIDKRLANYFDAEFVEFETVVIKETIFQLEEYFEGKRQVFELPLKFTGTPFQILVWSELQKIAYGKTQSYFQLAKKIGSDKAIRAVANANSANAISIIVPCHRVIGSNGALRGYAGSINTKRRLIELEKSNLLTDMQLKFDF